MHRDWISRRAIVWTAVEKTPLVLLAQHRRTQDIYLPHCTTGQQADGIPDPPVFYRLE